MVDLIKIKVKAGAGGDGIVSWHHEKYRPNGGPDGGNGGNGGSIYIETDTNLLSLADLSSQAIFNAKSGQRGGKNNCSGRGAEDLVIKVPVGTVVRVVGAGSPSPSSLAVNGRGNIAPTEIADLTKAGQKVLVAQGGVGGLGNHVFRSSTNQQPHEHTLGTLGEGKELVLELKILADVGLVGLPSSGKSTLLNKLTGASSRVGAYAFTTLEPSLGVLNSTIKPLNHLNTKETDSENGGMLAWSNGKIVLADLPGLIEGASEGRGLGDEFLRHIERCKVLVHLVSAENIETFKESYKTVRTELTAWSKELAKKPEIIVLSKADLLRGKPKLPKPVLKISAETGEGLEGLIGAIGEILQETSSTSKVVAEKEAVAERQTSSSIYTINNLPNKRVVFKK